MTTPNKILQTCNTHPPRPALPAFDKVCCAELGCGGVRLDGSPDPIAVQLLHVELCVLLQAACDDGHSQLLRGGKAVARVVLVTAGHDLRQALDHERLLVLGAVQQQQAVVAPAWGAALLLVCAATVTACGIISNWVRQSELS